MGEMVGKNTGYLKNHTCVSRQKFGAVILLNWLIDCSLQKCAAASITSSAAPVTLGLVVLASSVCGTVNLQIAIL